MVVRDNSSAGRRIVVTWLMMGFFAAALMFWPQDSFSAGNRHGVAVIIGNKNYAHSRVPEVTYAHNDADAFKRYVIDVLGFREGNVIDLRDATQAQMTSVLGKAGYHRGKAYQYVRPGKSDLVVYYSGHGVPGLRDKRGYLLPVDADPATAEINGLPLDTVYANLEKIDAKSVTVVIDACFSGDSPKGMLVESASPVFIKTKLPQTTNKIVLLTAASGDQVASWDKRARQGLFTVHLLKALYGLADQQDWGNGDGKVTLAEVKAYLEDEMSYAARRHYNRDQNATVVGEEGKVMALVDKDRAPLRFGDDKVAIKGPEPPVKKPDPVPEKRTEEPVKKPAMPDKVAIAKPPAKPEPSWQVTPRHLAMWVDGNRSVNVRAGPGSKQQLIGRLGAGQRVNVTGRVDGMNWYRIALADGSDGYVYSKLLRSERVVKKPAPPKQKDAVLRPPGLNKGGKLSASALFDRAYEHSKKRPP